VHGPRDPLTAVFRSVSEQARGLEAGGHVVDVLTRDDIARPGWARIDPVLLPILLLFRRLDTYDIVIFHSYMGWGFHWLRSLIDPRRRVTTITWFHGVEPLYQRALVEEHGRMGRTLSLRFQLFNRLFVNKLLKASTHASDAVFCFNSLEAEFLTMHRWADAERISCVANAVEAACLMSRQHRPVARRLLFVGQWLPAKGTRYLVDAFVSLSARHDVELACVGTGMAVTSVLAAFPASVRPRVTVRPRVSREQVHIELADADVFVFPSLSEGFSCALLEAMASELPIVATRVGAAVDLLQDGGNGALVPCADAAALDAAVSRLLTDAPLRARVGAAAGITARRFMPDTVRAEFASSVLEAVRHHGAMQAPQQTYSRDALR
jgi:glycosyltransferase involved in cell wall biosynthesis